MAKFSVAFLTFSLKIPSLLIHFLQILEIIWSRPPWASPSHSWGGRGYLLEKFVLVNLTFQTCNLKIKYSGLSLDKFWKGQKTSKLHVTKVRLKRTKFRKRYPRPLQERPELAQGSRDRDNARIRGNVSVNLGFLKEMSKSNEYSTTKIPANYIISAFDFFYILATGQYTRGKRKKPKFREGRRNVRHKRSEKYKRSGKILSCFFDVFFKNPKFAHTFLPDPCIISVAKSLGQSRSLLGRTWLPFLEIWPGIKHISKHI